LLVVEQEQRHQDTLSVLENKQVKTNLLHQLTSMLLGIELDMSISKLLHQVYSLDIWLDICRIEVIVRIFETMQVNRLLDDEILL